jgi:hypothetical protein
VCADDERVMTAFKLANAASERWRRQHPVMDEWGHVDYAFLDEEGNVDEAALAARPRDPHRLPCRLINRTRALVALAVAAAAAVDTRGLWPPPDDETVTTVVDQLVEPLILAPAAPPRPGAALAAA